MTHGTTPSTVIWCGTVKECLTDVEKAILYHEHEAKRNRFFGMMPGHEYHVYMAGAIRRMKTYSDSTKDKYRDQLLSNLVR